MSTEAKTLLASLSPYIIAITLPLIGLVYGLTARDIAKNERRIDAHEVRIQAVERNSDVSANELRHIREDIADIKRLLLRGASGAGREPDPMSTARR